MNSQMRKILIVGCGNIGSRHLQAVAKLPFPILVEVVEPSPDAQKTAKARFGEIPRSQETKISWCTSLDSLQELKKGSDLAIVATNSVGRASTIEKLLEMGHTRLLIEKIVCQSKEEYEKVLANVNKFKAKAWVNTNRRYFGFYQQLKKMLSDPQENLQISVVTGAEGLGCNAIHFIDLFSYLTNKYDVKLCGDFLLPQLFDNRRGADLKEFAGMIPGSAENNQSTFSVTFLPYANQPTTIVVAGKDKRLLIEESINKITVLKGFDELKNLPFAVDYVSNITKQVAIDIFEKDTCLLPTLEQSSLVHYELFRIFNDHLKRMTGKSVVLCPIT